MSIKKKAYKQCSSLYISAQRHHFWHHKLLSCVPLEPTSFMCEKPLCHSTLEYFLCGIPRNPNSHHPCLPHSAELFALLCCPSACCTVPVLTTWCWAALPLSTHCNQSMGSHTPHEVAQKKPPPAPNTWPPNLTEGDEICCVCTWK